MFLINQSTWRVSAKFLGAASEEEGRTILFAGSSNMICPTRGTCSNYQCPGGYVLKDSARWTACQGEVCTIDDLYTCCDCDETYMLRFTELDYSNLAGVGPSINSPSGMRALNVFPKSGFTVDMTIDTLGHYWANNATEYLEWRVHTDQCEVRNRSRLESQVHRSPHRTAFQSSWLFLFRLRLGPATRWWCTRRNFTLHLQVVSNFFT